MPLELGCKVLGDGVWQHLCPHPQPRCRKVRLARAQGIWEPLCRGLPPPSSSSSRPRAGLLFTVVLSLRPQLSGAVPELPPHLGMTHPSRPGPSDAPSRRPVAVSAQNPSQGASGSSPAALCVLLSGLCFCSVARCGTGARRGCRRGVVTPPYRILLSPRTVHLLPSLARPMLRGQG